MRYYTALQRACLQRACLLIACLLVTCSLLGAVLGCSLLLSSSATLDAEGGGDGGEDGDEEVDDGFPIFFFHLLLLNLKGFALRLSPWLIDNV